MKDVPMPGALILAVPMTSRMIKRKRAQRNFLAPFFFSPRVFWLGITSLT